MTPTIGEGENSKTICSVGQIGPQIKVGHLDLV